MFSYLCLFNRCANQNYRIGVSLHFEQVKVTLIMFQLFIACVLSDSYPLPRDDTYHQYIVPAKGEIVYWVQPSKKSSILIVSNITNYIAEIKEVGSATFTAIKSETTEREHLKTITLNLEKENPLELKVKCTLEAGECKYVIRNVHTEPVYRTSAVLGAFSLFICLFILVFSWTIFCGACRATRKR